MKCAQTSRNEIVFENFIVDVMIHKNCDKNTVGKKKCIDRHFNKLPCGKVDVYMGDNGCLSF